MQDVNLISQVYPFRKDRKNDLALRIFLNEDSPSTFYTSRAKSWHEYPKGVFRDVEIPSSRVAGGRSRVKGVLKDAERYTEVFLLYNKFFRDRKNNLGIPRDRLSIGYIYPFVVEHFQTMNKILKEINNCEKPIMFDDNKNVLFLPMYDHAEYIRHHVHM